MCLKTIENRYFPHPLGKSNLMHRKYIDIITQCFEPNDLNDNYEGKSYIFIEKQIIRPALYYFQRWNVHNTRWASLKPSGTKI